MTQEDSFKGTMAREKQRKTFLSYSRENKDFALKLAKELKAEGFHVWLDTLDIPTGSRWDSEVEKALEECEIFMIIMTPASIASENVRDEIGYAIDAGKRFLPVMLEKCVVPLRLRRFQYVDFTNKSFDDGVESAKDLLRNLIAQISIPQQGIPADPQNQITEEKVQSKATEKSTPAAIRTESTSAPTIERKRTSQGLIMGTIGLIILALGLISYRAFSQSRNNHPPTANPATEAATVANLATEAPVISEPVTETTVAILPSDVPTAGPIMTNTLSSSKAQQLFENTKALSKLARETYGEAQFNTIINSGNLSFVVENSTLEPLTIGSADCALSQELLYENLNHIDYFVEFNGQRLSDNNILSFYSSSNDGTHEWFCRTAFVILGNWESGQKYNIRDTEYVRSSYSDGVNSYSPGPVYTREFIVSIP